MAAATNATKPGILDSVIGVFKASPMAAIILVVIGLVIGIIIDRILSMTMM